jgi:ABC-type proline/glycine betaine transport system permease subunit
MERLIVIIGAATFGYYVSKGLETKNDAMNIAIAACLASLSTKIKL